jgi:hypothetical protein
MLHLAKKGAGRFADQPLCSNLSVSFGQIYIKPMSNLHRSVYRIRYSSILQRPSTGYDPGINHLLLAFQGQFPHFVFTLG